MAKPQAKTTAAKNDKNDKKEDPNVPMPPSVTYSVEDINQVMNYLGNRPYVEVAGLIQIMQSGKSS